MNNKLTKSVLIGLLVVLVISIGATAAFAQDGETPTTPATPAIPFGHGGFHDRGHGGGDDEALANALGISVEELQAARQKAAAERIAQAVEAGYITQDQANTLLAMQALKDYIDHEAILAQALGLSADELAAAREDGTLRDLLDNITPANLQARMQEATTAAIQMAVADNVINQTQADLVLEQLENGVGLGGKFGGYDGPHGGPHGSHGGFRGTAPRVDESGEALGSPNIPAAPAFGA